MAQWFLEVTDLKQYTYCPRIVFYRYCLPDIRPLTVLMEEGIHQHEQEDVREDRCSLRHYGLKEGERSFHTVIRSESLGLVGSMDLVIVTPARTVSDAQAIVVEYKYSEQKRVRTSNYNWPPTRSSSKKLGSSQSPRATSTPSRSKKPSP
jgi:CRISPR-associated exonuclease Cas4